MNLPIFGIDNILFAIGDFSQARAFYEMCLGLQVKFVVAEAGIIAYRLGDEEPGLLLRVQDTVSPPSCSATHVWLEVPDARATAQQLRDRGVPLLGDPWEVGTGWVVEIADPWGNVIGFTDYHNMPQKARKVPVAKHGEE